MIFVFHILAGLQQKYLRLKTLQDEFQTGFCNWVSTRKHTRKLLRELERELFSSGRGTERREAPANPPRGTGWSTLTWAGIVAVGVLTAGAAVPVAAAVGAAANFGQNLGDGGAGAAGDGAIVEVWKRIKLDEVRRAIVQDKTACHFLLESSQKLLGNCVADFAVFCNDHIDLVLSSELVEGEFRFLLDILRGAHSPGAAVSAQLPMLLEEEVNIHDTRVSTLMERLRRSTEDQELLSITQRILRELREGPNDGEIPTMIKNFIQAKFTEACKS